MKKWTPSKITWRVIGFITLVLVISALLDVLSSGITILSKASPSLLSEYFTWHSIPTPTPTLTPTPLPVAPIAVDNWQSSLESDIPIKGRNVKIDFYKSRVDLQLSLTIPMGHPLVTGFFPGFYENELPGFVYAYFGEFKINGEILEFKTELPQWEFNDGNMVVTILKSVAKPDAFTTQSMDFQKIKDFSLESDRVEVTAIGGNIYFTNVLPEEKTAVSEVFFKKSPETIRNIDVSVNFPEIPVAVASATPTLSDIVKASGTATPSPTPTPGPSRQSVLQKTGGTLFPIKSLNPIFYNILVALPILLFLFLLGRLPKQKQPDYVQKIKLVMGVLLIFHFTLAMLESIETFYRGSSQIKLLSQILERQINLSNQPFTQPVLQFGVTRLEIIAAGILLPYLLLRYANPARSDRQTQRWKWIGILSVLSSLMIAAFAFLDLMKLFYFELNIGTIALFAVGVSALLIFLLLFPFYKIATLTPLSLTTGLLSIWTLILIPIINNTRPAQELDSWEAALSIFMGVLLIIAFSEIILWAWSDEERIRMPKWGWWLLIAFGAAVAYPIGKVVDSRFTLDFSAIFTFAFQMDNFILYIWLGCIVLLLRKQGKYSLQIRPAARLFGILAASTLLVPYLGRWLFIPIPFLLCWFGLSWLIRKENYWKKFLESSQGQVLAERPRFLENIINLKAAEDAFTDLRKTLLGKFSDGSLRLSGYTGTLADTRRDLDEVSEKYKLNQHPLRELVLAYGPHSSAWENGLHGLKWSLLLAIPWMLVYIFSYLSSTALPFHYFLLDYALTILAIIARWGAFGFVMGYFYPYLRGSNGVQKGLFLFGLIIIATLPLYLILYDQASDWRAYFFLVLQFFIHFMLLGMLAFDYMTLRIKPHALQALFEFYGLPLFGISVSTIALSIGGVVVSLLTSQAGPFLTTLAKLIFPGLRNTP